jgi:CBS domain-containing protein
MDVSEIMTAEVVAVTPETAYKDVIEALLDHGVSGVPVVDDGMLVGIVTEADLLAGSAYDGDRSRALAVLADVLAAREHHWATKAGARTARDLMSRSVVSCTAETRRADGCTPDARPWRHAPPRRARWTPRRHRGPP